MKRRLIIVIIFVVIVVILGRLYSNSKVSKLDRIVRKYGKQESYSTYYKKGEEIELLEIKYKMPWFESKQPKEVYALFESILYLNKKENSVPSNTIITIDMGKAGWPDASLSRDEFLELCGQVDINILNYNKKDIKELSELWIDTYFYYRSRINNPEYREDYINLLTPIDSSQEYKYDDDNYKEFYIGEYNLVFDGNSRNYYSETFDVIHNIDKENFYFGQWDNKERFWFYDKNNGLNLIETATNNDRAYNIVQQYYINLNEMPETFARAYTIHSDK